MQKAWIHLTWVVMTSAFLALAKGDSITQLTQQSSTDSRVSDCDHTTTACQLPPRV